MHTPVSLFTSEAEKTTPSSMGSSMSSMGSDSIDLAKGQRQSLTQSLKSIESDPIDALNKLSNDAATCRLCALAEGRTQVVFGVGNAQADVLFIGEAAGRDEDIKGEPFVGASGQLLDRMLHAIGLDRAQVYLLNTVKCHPPNNRDPQPDEVQACNHWLEQQLAIVQPKIICLLGRVAAQTLLQTDAPLASLRGHWHDYQGIPVRVTYHPAYLLRSPRQKNKSWQDLGQLSQRLQTLQS